MFSGIFTKFGVDERYTGKSRNWVKMPFILVYVAYEEYPKTTICQL